MRARRLLPLRIGGLAASSSAGPAEEGAAAASSWTLRSERHHTRHALQTALGAFPL